MLTRICDSSDFCSLNCLVIFIIKSVKCGGKVCCNFFKWSVVHLKGFEDRTQGKYGDQNIMGS